MLYCATAITVDSTQLSLDLLLFIILTLCTKLWLMLLEVTENHPTREKMCSFLTISPVITTFPRNTGNPLEMLTLWNSKQVLARAVQQRRHLNTLKRCEGNMGKCRTFHTTFLLFLAVHLQLQPHFPIPLTIARPHTMQNLNRKACRNSLSGQTLALSRILL